jgi:hypothetical protein
MLQYVVGYIDFKSGLDFMLNPTLRNDINKALDNMQNGSLNVLKVFQENLQGLVDSVNNEVDISKLRRKDN